jgi:ribosome biogenesis protein SSF1/2
MSRRSVNLANQDDIADYLIRRVGTPGSEGYDSLSESEASEAESDSNAVELPDDYVGRGNKKGERKAVKLLETGPRLELKLIKIVEGLVGSKRGEGQTVFHEFESRTKSQSSAQQKDHNARRKLLEQRRAEQAENVARKKAEKAKSKKGKGEDAEEEEDDEDDEDRPDVDGLSDFDSDVDPEEALIRRRERAAAKKAAKDDTEEDSDDEFDYEDGVGADDDDDWDMDAEAGDVPSEEEEEEDSDSEDEPAPPPRKRPGKR